MNVTAEVHLPHRASPFRRAGGGHPKEDSQDDEVRTEHHGRLAEAQGCGGSARGANLMLSYRRDCGRQSGFPLRACADPLPIFWIPLTVFADTHSDTHFSV